MGELLSLSVIVETPETLVNRNPKKAKNILSIAPTVYLALSIVRHI